MYQSVDCINPTRLVCVCMIYNIMYGVRNIIVVLFQNVDLKGVRGGSIVLTMLHVHTSFTNVHNIIGKSSYEFMSLVWKKIDASFCNALLLVITRLTS